MRHCELHWVGRIEISMKYNFIGFVIVTRVCVLVLRVRSFIIYTKKTLVRPWVVDYICQIHNFVENDGLDVVITGAKEIRFV